jgi:type VI secretion system secreted protein Hcp
MSRRQQSPVLHDPNHGTNRREVLFGAGGLAAVAALGGQARERDNLPAVQLTGSIDSIGQFEVIELSAGANNASTGSLGSGGGAGKASFQDFEFTKVTDATSPKLFIACAMGRHLKHASFTVTPRAGSPVIRYDFDDVQVTSFSIDENTTDRPTETVMFAFSTIQITVDGVTAGWDVGNNVAI